MNCKKLFFLAALMQAGVALAGDLLTNTNQSVHFLRNPARDASTEIDAAYTNPAGLVKLTDGFHFSFNNQSAFQTRTITSTASVFGYNGGNTTRSFEGTASAPIIPSLMGAYKKDKWVLSGALAIVGGGGKATFSDGLPSFESLAGGTTAIAAGVLKQQGLPVSTPYLPYTVNQYMKGTNFIIGGQLGLTYEIDKNFSAYLGFRMNMVRNRYEGYMKGFEVTALGDKTNATYNAVISTYTPVVTALTAKAAAGALTDAEKQTLSTATAALAGAKFAAQASSANGIQLDSKQSGWGVAPIIGINYHWNDRLTLAAKYEFKAKLNVENDTKVDDTGLFKHGVNTPYDIPAMLSLGAAYKIMPSLTASVGYHHFFDTDARMENDKQKNAGNTNEYLLGLEYQVTDKLLLSAGGQITDYGVNDAYQKDISFACSSYSVGLGGSYAVTPKVKINLGYFWTTYSDYIKQPGGGITASTATEKDIFSRTNKVFGAGVDFSF